MLNDVSKIFDTVNDRLDAFKVKSVHMYFHAAIRCPGRAKAARNITRVGGGQMLYVLM